MSHPWLSLLVGLIPLTPLAAQGLAYEGGVSLATGRYIFAARTTSWTFATGLSLSAGRLTLRAGLPVFVQNTSLITGSGAGMMPSGGGAASGMVSDSGHHGMMGGSGSGTHRLPVPGSALTGYRAAAGDPTVQAGWRAVSDARTSLTISGAAKIPVTDTSTYGTGAWDVGATVSVTRHAGASMFLGLDLSYWHVGDLPQLNFRDPVLATASLSDLFENTWGASLSVTAGSSALPGYQAPVSVGATLTHLGKGNLWGLNAAVGLTETVPDFSIGASWRIGF